MKTNYLKPHDLLLYKRKSFVSKLIQWGTKSVYSHVAVILNPQIYLAVESDTGHQSGVRAVDLRKLDEGIVDVYRIKVDFGFDGDKVVSYLVNCLGAKFDYVGVTWLGILKGIGALTGFKYQPYNQFQKDKDYFCSELVYQAFDAGGLDIVPQIDKAEITSPGDIAHSELLAKVARQPGVVVSTTGGVV